MKKGASWSELLDRAIQVALDRLLNKKHSSSKTYKDNKSSFDKYAQTKTRNELISRFANNLLVLTSEVMKADGKVMKSELNFVKDFFYLQFPKNFASIRIKMLREVIKESYSVEKAAKNIIEYMPLGQRKILLEYLFQLAKADGNIVKEEVSIIDRIAKTLGYAGAGYEHLKAKYLKIASKSEYAILGIKKDASWSEVKKAYRTLANEYHPDKQIGATDEEKKVAKKKFQQIQNAYEKIAKERDKA